MINEAISVEFVVAFDHGILVLEDSVSRAEHQDWNIYTHGFHVEPDSLYVGVIPSMEGPVTVRLIDHPLPDLNSAVMVFEGKINIPSGVMVFGDSDRNIEIRLPVRRRVIHASVFVDEIGLASRAIVALAM